MIERYLIHYFLAVVDQGNFSRAAQQCRVSQPTLSVGIAKLETLVGHVLFHRSNRRVELTASGTRFLTHARHIEAEFAKAAQAMAQDDERKLIRVGLIPTLPSAWIEAATRAACRVDAEKLEIVEGRMRDLLPRLERGRIDALVGLMEPDAPRGDILFEEGYALALADTHPLASRTMLEPAEVADAEMIVRRNCEALTDVSRFFTQRGIRPFFSARTTNEDRAVGYVRSGLGITVMPQCFMQPGLAMPKLSGFEQRRRIGIIVAPPAVGRVKDSQSLNGFASILKTIATATV